MYLIEPRLMLSRAVEQTLRSRSWWTSSFFCGYSLIEIASMRGVSERTAQRDWDKARVLLKRALEGRDLLPE